MISRDLRHAQNVGARHRWLNRLQTALLVLTLLGIAAVAGSLLLGDGGLWLALAAAGFTLLLEPAAASGLTLRLYGARPLHPDEAPDLWAVLRELAARAGLPAVPVPHYVPSGVVNAFATGSKHHAAIALTDGLLRSLTPRELTGVLGHEIAHIANEDLRVMGLADSISRLKKHDVIDLSAIDADVDTAGDQAFHRVKAFGGHAGEMVLSYAGGVTTVQLDVDGDGQADMAIQLAQNHLTYHGFVL